MDVESVSHCPSSFQCRIPATYLDCTCVCMHHYQHGTVAQPSTTPVDLRLSIYIHYSVMQRENLNGIFASVNGLEILNNS
ncbi:hypothetical protein IV72_GL000375 [Atopobium minutum]|nr:hypothetical protein HMPREF1247_1156 [Atopobium sp. BV3Ac4]KRN54883.1 hypothetical protein IV72_GL000375 [Atopobium minutum]